MRTILYLLIGCPLIAQPTWERVDLAPLQYHATQPNPGWGGYKPSLGTTTMSKDIIYLPGRALDFTLIMPKDQDVRRLTPEALAEAAVIVQEPRELRQAWAVIEAMQARIRRLTDDSRQSERDLAELGLIMSEAARKALVLNIDFHRFAKGFLRGGDAEMADANIKQAQADLAAAEKAIVYFKSALNRSR